MRKALITFLGTGIGKRTTGTAQLEYRKTAYKMTNGEVSEPTPFIGLYLNQALVVDDLHIFGTTSSMWSTLLDYLSDRHYKETEVPISNLVDFCFDQNGTDSIIEKQSEIENSLSEMLDNKSFIHFHDSVNNETKMWSLFGDLAETMKNYNEIHIDITHGFRHLPLFVVTALSYITSLYPSIKVRGLYYGNFESKKDRNDENEPADIVDLLPAWEMMNWFHAARDFALYGNGKDLSSLLEAHHPDLAKTFLGINDTLQITFIEGFSKRLAKMERLFDQEESSPNPDPRITPLRPLMTDINGMVDRKKPEWYNQIKTAQWYHKRCMYQQALTALVEGIKSYVLVHEGEDWKDRDTRDTFFKHHFDWRKQNAILGKDGKKYYENIRKWRNEINHAGLLHTDAAGMTKTVIDSIGRLFSDPQLEKILSKA
ncbi:MAG: TIGR02221 family CRISPR-associated protein [Bacteroidota bacterium]|nr:TIGR02221 family CRISPR-associated protein [Bacteroidota bacterium]